MVRTSGRVTRPVQPYEAEAAVSKPPSTRFSSPKSRISKSTSSKSESSHPQPESPKPQGESLTRAQAPAQTPTHNEILSPYPTATLEERRAWKGWHDFESSADEFNRLLKGFGVMGLEVCIIISLFLSSNGIQASTNITNQASDVWAMSEDFFIDFPKPLHGLIFCFQYQECDEGKSETTMPDVWFANQLSGTLACGTIAIMNIINNITDANLGPELQKFKDETMDMDPMERGKRLNAFDHIRAVHNRDASKIDILMQDYNLLLERQHDKKYVRKQRAVTAAAAKKPTGITKSTTKGKGKTKAAPKVETKPKFNKNTRYHFIAFTPVNDVLVKLDGFDEHPQSLGPCTADAWLPLALEWLDSRIKKFPEANDSFVLTAIHKKGVGGPFSPEKQELPVTDYGPAIHIWLSELAKIGKLKELAETWGIA